MAGILPMTPLSVKILGADISPHALEIYQSQVKRLEPCLAAAGILVKLATRRWDAADVQQTTDLFDDYLGEKAAHNEYLVLVANFSGASKALFNQFEDSFRQIWIRLGGKVSRFSTILWVEPKADDGVSLFKRLLKLANPYNWFQRTSGQKVYHHECEYKFKIRMQNKLVLSGVMVRSYTRKTENTRTSTESRLLHIRSLNNLSRDHPFSYIGARILAESLHPDIIESWSNEYVARKAQTARRQVYWKHSIFKGFDPNGRPEYRKCVIGSPTTHLTEVWLLKRLSQEEVFAQHPNVYSYFWSRDESTHVFRYYFKGHMEREHAIAAAAGEMSNSRVIVLDLRKFYPSVDVATLRSRFAKRIEGSGLSPFERETAIRCVEELTSIKHEVGLPVGPPLSHILANVFLEAFDKILSEEFRGCYFRYVDDIAIIVPSSAVESAKRLFERVADGEGLRVNSDKTDILTGKRWAARVMHRQHARQDEFFLFVSDLRRYLAHNVEDFERVRDLFRAEEFHLPFSRLRSVASSSGTFRRFLKRLWSRSGGLFGDNIPRPPEFLERARYLRGKFETRLRQATAQSLPSSSMERRWTVQDIRYFLNRSLYLLPVRARGEILDLIPDCLELRPSKAVLSALVTGDASELTKYPGPTVSSFCELWTETTSELPTFVWSNDPLKEERDAASTLALCGLCVPPVEWINQLKEQSSQVMVKLSARQRPARRTFDDFSYIDEMESLFLKPGVDIDRLLCTRFDDGEDVILPTLSLGGGQSMT
jgi:hypothetical protein